MSYHIIDQDAYERVITSRPCTNCGGALGPCRGRCNGSASIGSKRRSAAEIAQIKSALQAQQDRSSIKAAIAALNRIGARGGELPSIEGLSRDLAKFVD